MRLTIVRHGLTDNGKESKFQHPHSPLNEEGLAQARAVAERLRNEHFDIAYVSDFERTKATAQEILRYHPATPVEYTKQLRECNTGTFGGKHVSEFLEAAKASGLSLGRFRPDGGESMEDAQERVLRFYEKMAEKQQGQSVLIVGHGMIMTCLLLALLKKPLSEYEKFRFQNTGITVIERDDAGAHTIHVLNSTEHLGEDTNHTETATE